MYVDDHHDASARSDGHNVIPALVSGYVNDDRTLRQVVKNENSRPTCVYIVRRKRTKHTEMEEQDMGRLQEFILPV